MRKANRGILFYSMDVGHVTNKRIRLLLNDHGPTGYWVWCCIIDHSYKVDGYFHKADNDDIELLSADICRQPPEMVYRIIESCIKRGLFDRRVFEKCNVLTSDRMQVNYINATYDRRRKGTSIYFSESHFVISQQELSGFGDKQLEGIYFLETGKPISSFLGHSTENPQTSAEQSLFSTEKQINSTENHGNSVHKGKERIYKDTNVSYADASENGTIGIKKSNENELSSSAKKNSPPKKKVARKKKGRDPDSEPYWHVLRRKWVDFNKTHLKFNVEPIPTGDYSSMHRIIEKLRARATDQGVPWTEQEAVIRWEKFLSTAYNEDAWLHKNFDLKCLEAKQQVVYQIIENGNEQRSKINGTNRKADQSGRPIIDPNATSSGTW